MTRFERWVQAVADVATATEAAIEAKAAEAEALMALNACRHVLTDVEDGISACIEPDCGYVAVDSKVVA